jgi:hypothetical protein
MNVQPETPACRERVARLPACEISDSRDGWPAEAIQSFSDLPSKTRRRVSYAGIAQHREGALSGLNSVRVAIAIPRKLFRLQRPRGRVVGNAPCKGLIGGTPLTSKAPLAETPQLKSGERVHNSEAAWQGGRSA